MTKILVKSGVYLCPPILPQKNTIKLKDKQCRVFMRRRAMKKIFYICAILFFAIQATFAKGKNGGYITITDWSKVLSNYKTYNGKKIKACCLTNEIKYAPMNKKPDPGILVGKTFAAYHLSENADVDNLLGSDFYIWIYGVVAGNSKSNATIEVTKISCCPDYNENSTYAQIAGWQDVKEKGDFYLGKRVEFHDKIGGIPFSYEMHYGPSTLDKLCFYKGHNNIDSPLYSLYKAGDTHLFSGYVVKDENQDITFYIEKTDIDWEQQ